MYSVPGMLLTRSTMLPCSLLVFDTIGGLTPAQGAGTAQAALAISAIASTHPSQREWLAHVWGEIAFCWPGAEWISSVFRGLLSKQPQIS